MDGDGDVVFVYLGGEQEVPYEITHAIIDPSVNIVRRRAFRNRRRLVSIIFHDGVEIIEADAFFNCESLSGRIVLLGVREIRERAFDGCYALSDVEFGDRLETIGEWAFASCSLRSIKIPSVRSVQTGAFVYCSQLTDAEFGINLRTIGRHSFHDCPNLLRITIPLKYNLFRFDSDNQRYDQFDECEDLTTVDIVGTEKIHKTISSLLMGSWSDEMNDEIDRINWELRGTPSRGKTRLIRRWIRSVINRLDHYKVEHNRLLKEGMALLELAIWKAKLDEKAKFDTTSARNEQRIMSGADIVIRNVVPFLQLDE